MDDILRRMSDDELVASLKNLSRDERRNLVAILKHLAAMDDRRIAGRNGFPSLFEYCVRELHYAEGETARRIHAARAAAEYPSLYSGLAHGKLSLTSVSLLAPHLTRGNHRRLIRKAWGRATREVETLVAGLNAVREPVERTRLLRPLEPAVAPNEVRLLPAAGEAPEPQSRPPAPPAPLRVHFSFTGAPTLLEAVERAKGLLRSKYPSPGLEEVFTEAVDRLLRQLEPKRAKRGARPAAVGAGRGRAIPRPVKDEVWIRDGGRCAYVSAAGRRCDATTALQYDHIVPWAVGGSSDAANLRLLCRAHNALEARRFFGAAKMDAHAAPARES